MRGCCRVCGGYNCIAHPEGYEYRKGFTVEAFFQPYPKAMDVGGWLIRGYDQNDEYQEVVHVGEWKQPECFKLIEGWIEWIRVPIPKGSPLLTKEESYDHRDRRFGSG